MDELLLCDSHAHLGASAYDEDRDVILAEAFRGEGGLSWIIDVGTDLESSRKAIALSAAWPRLRATVGVHPHDARHYPEEALAEVLTLAGEPGVVALGEMGLDYHYDYSDRPSQRRCFERQIEEALRRDMPVVVHVREAREDALAILGSASGDRRFRGVWHCFSEDADTALRALDLGLHVSFTGILTFPKSEEIREAARVVPPERVMVETDSPYLSPRPHRGKRNHPLWVVEVARALAALHSMSLQEMAKITTANACRLFGLSEGKGGFS